MNTDGPAADRAGGLTRRRVRFAFPDDLEVAWNPTNPEFSYAANAVSLLMPYAEPYFISSVRKAIPDLEGELAAIAQVYVRQEAEHHKEHRRFNDLLVHRLPGLQRAERQMAAVYGWLSRTRSLRFNLAFAAASETIAFSLARWAVGRLDDFFGGADPVAATVYLWHLAEEVEHKSVAFDVWEAVDGRRLRYSLAMATTFSILAFFSIWTMLVMLWGDRRLHRPGTQFRLVALTFSFLFHCIPDLVASAMPRHHPTQMADPPWLTDWLGGYDPETATMPVWNTSSLV